MASSFFFSPIFFNFFFSCCFHFWCELIAHNTIDIDYIFFVHKFAHRYTMYTRYKEMKGYALIYILHNFDLSSREFILLVTLLI